jgi:glutamate N-acetyltransferase/amino-acid N-acetyltransferase
MTAARGITFARGFTAGAAVGKVKHGDDPRHGATGDRLDVALLVADRACSSAAVFTSNLVIAAPLAVTRRHLANGSLRAVVVNSGNANACTGATGERDALAMAEAAAEKIGSRPDEVAVASTGVIGVPLPIDRIAKAVARIRPTEDGWDAFSRAIMTTDTRPKVAERELRLASGAVRVGGVAKGSGMIHPDMATLLVFLTTDAAIDPASLKRALRAAVSATFNAISVDGDTSTNDMALVLASGASGVTVSGDAHDAFTSVLTDVCADLARAVVGDGEGATKVFEIRVRGAASDEDASRAARTITTSNLVKTAIHGADPNWGRILAAAGRSGARVDERRASVRIGDVDVFRRGAPCSWDPAAVRRIFERPEIAIEVDLGLGSGTARAWGCDLSEEYVQINADYTT